MNNRAKIIPFKVEHIEVMDIREYELNTAFALESVQSALKIFEQGKTAGTIVYNGRVIAIIGLQRLWPGVCELWVIPSRHIKENAVPFARTLRKALCSGILNSYHRVQIHALDDDLHNRFMRFLGFEKEGTLRKYDSLGKDMNIWARIQ